ncbi:MAG: hypothetical protein Q7R92_01310 [bacterium]|nr:hypothetical protein [bacterium]
MKACFLLQRRFAYVGHKVAVILKEKYGVENFCGYVYLRSSFEFLKNQKEINYTSLILDEDLHERYHNEKLDLAFLNNFEQEYGIPNLWPYVTLDRVVMFNMLAREYPYDTPKYTHEEMMKIFQVKAKAILYFLESEKPDFIFMTIVGSISSLLLYEIAKKKNIKIFIGAETRINNGYTLTENYKNFSYAKLFFIKNKVSGQKLAEAKKYLLEFREHPAAFYYDLKSEIDVERGRQINWLFSKKFFQSLSWFLIICWRYFFKKQFRDYCDEQPLTYFFDRLRRKVRSLIGFKHLYDEIDLKEDFAFFPLHLEPEVATMLMAPFWTDQINLIKQIAKSLPLHFKLYVKEHPTMVGYRTHDYYKKLKKIPNVKLVNPRTGSFDLLKNAKLITTITGTTGWEGILFKKPIITFGDVFYNALSTVKHCHEIEQLPFLIKKQLENFRHDETELENFIGAILEESAPIDLTKIWEQGEAPEIEKEKLTLLVDLIAKKLDLKLRLSN